MKPHRPSSEEPQHRARQQTHDWRVRVRQVDVARMVGRPQSWVARIERDDRLRVDVIEFLALAAAIGFDPVKAVRRLLQRERAAAAPKVL
jgi:hypothetical protein